MHYTTLANCIWCCANDNKWSLLTETDGRVYAILVKSGGLWYGRLPTTDKQLPPQASLQQAMKQAELGIYLRVVA